MRGVLVGRGEPVLLRVGIVGPDRFVLLIGFVGPGESGVPVGVAGSGESIMLVLGVTGSRRFALPVGVAGPGGFLGIVGSRQVPDGVVVL
jgi:hypothetical protein